MTNSIPPLANPELQWQMAVSAFRQGQVTQVRHLLKPLLALPNLNGEVLLLAGMTEAQLNNLDAAENFLSKSVKLVPNRIEGWATLGNIKREQGNSMKAVELYKRALKIDPNHVSVLSNLGSALNDIGLCYEALQHFDKALKMEPELSLALDGRIHALRALRRSQEVIDCYKTLIKKAPDNAILYIALAEFYESCNQLEEAENTLPPIDIVNSDILKSRFAAIKAQLSARNHNYESALSYIKEAQLHADSHSLHYQEGVFLDKLNRFPEAFSAFKKGNEQKIETFQAQRLNVDAAPEYVAQKMLKGIQLPDNAGSAAPKRTVHFIVGLPRSGTTLLDRMLDAHPDLQIFEEFNALRVADDALANGVSLQKARKLYWEKIEQHTQLGKGKIFIDKNPINSMLVDIIPRLFPNSQVIVALRHPFDAALSCYMQNFDINTATLQFTDLKRTGDFCVQLLTFIKQLEQARPEKTLRIYYESLVKDYQKELASLLEKLNIPWHDDILNYRQKLQEAGNIHTASYAQVTEKTHQKALERWKQYEPFISDITEPLKEIADFFYANNEYPHP